MFIAITFYCLVSGECRFIQDDQISTKEVCESRNEALSEILDSNPKIDAYQTHCIKVPERVV